MALDLQEPVCWRAARPCPLSDLSSIHKLSCQAWFHCEMAGDYVIRWRCQSLEEGELNITSASLSLCSNQSDATDFMECPPPVVCADDPSLDKRYQRSSDISTDVILATAVSIFAFLAMALIVISSYKYWRLRKRMKQRLPRHCLVREFPYPMRYHNLWGTKCQQYDYPDVSKKSSSPKLYENSHVDVYFSRPQESSKGFERLLSPLNDKKEFLESGPCSLKRHFASAPSFSATDPSIATGSFVYHQPVGVGLMEFDGRIENIVHKNKMVNTEGKENGFESCNTFKGSILKFHTKERHHLSGNTANHAAEYKRLQKNSPDFKRAPQISSINIPTYELGGPQTTMAQHEYLNPDLQIHEDFDEHFFKRRNYEPSISHESVPHYALGFITSPGISQHYINQREDHKSNIYQSVNATPAATAHPSPDVISSHNFTNKFVRVGKNFYRPLQSRSACTNSIDTSSSGSGKVDLSYDSFRNEHLRELAKQVAASSSTLEVGSRQKPHEASAFQCRY